MGQGLAVRAARNCQPKICFVTYISHGSTSARFCNGGRGVDGWTLAREIAGETGPGRFGQLIVR